MLSAVMKAPAVAVDGPLSALTKTARRWFAYRDTSDALMKLTRRELADIGVDTSVDEFAWRVAQDVAERR